IMALGRPSVSRFAEFTSMSSANAADKVNKLVKKGYLRKIQSTEDKRVFYLEVTQRYLDYYNISYQYMETVMKRVEDKFSEEELQTVEHMLNVMNEELMNEVSLGR
ncbi:MAG: MarR family transcriptional regulator, partial [Eubacteriales bacterium]|nr:MarR family transcriptional regulator [Eubacteriales bacterium]